MEEILVGIEKGNIFALKIGGFGFEGIWNLKVKMKMKILVGEEEGDFLFLKGAIFGFWERSEIMLESKHLCFRLYGPIAKRQLSIQIN